MGSRKNMADMEFAVAKSVLVKYKNQDQVKKAFGEPTRVLRRESKELWNYDEQGTGYQRLTLTFNEAKQLEAVLWIPRPGEPEGDLKGVFSHYPDSKFSPVKTQEVAPPHSLNTETIYSNGRSTAIWYNDHAKRVEGVNWYIEDQRRPADSTKEN
jgi:hypothetical protein